MQDTGKMAVNIYTTLFTGLQGNSSYLHSPKITNIINKHLVNFHPSGTGIYYSTVYKKHNIWTEIDKLWNKLHFIEYKREIKQHALKME